MTRPFELLENKTEYLLRLTYWTRVSSSLNQTKTIDIQVGECIDIPEDNTVDEFNVEFEDYTDCVKFRARSAIDGNWRWDYTDLVGSTFDAESRKISLISTK